MRSELLPSACVGGGEWVMLLLLLVLLQMLLQMLLLNKDSQGSCCRSRTCAVRAAS